MPRATPGNRTRMAESRGKEPTSPVLTVLPTCSQPQPNSAPRRHLLALFTPLTSGRPADRLDLPLNWHRVHRPRWRPITPLAHPIPLRIWNSLCYVNFIDGIYAFNQRHKLSGPRADHHCVDSGEEGDPGGAAAGRIRAGEAGRRAGLFLRPL